jgi:hypothetical protein
MLHARIVFTFALTAVAVGAQAQDFGKYVGVVQAEWLTDGRRMRLLANFSYIDPKGQEWEAKLGRVVDGASIPQFAWSIIGGPFEGKYRNASVIHDIACEDRVRPWATVHEAFFWAMKASQVENWLAKTMYAAVYHLGPRWNQQVVVSNLPKEQTGVARERALEQAPPGSTVQTLNVLPRPRSPEEVLTNQPEQADFDIVVQAPPRQLNTRDFEKLKERIQASEASAIGGMSLDDIRAYRP